MENLNETIVPVVSYKNLEEYKNIIYMNNKDKSGIYRWTNIINNNSYIGSAVNLKKRLYNYFSTRFLEKELLRNKSIISSALLKYGYNNFRLDILEYCDKSVLIKREQYYIDTLQCKYNILKVAGSHLGVKRSPETLLKLKQRKFSPDAIIKMSLAKKGITPLFSQTRKNNHLSAVGHSITVFDKKYNIEKTYGSIRALSRDINISRPTIKKYMNKTIFTKNRYLITTKK